MKKLTVVITDDHNLFRKGIAALLSDFDFIGGVFEAADGAELLLMLETMDTLPDVILLDLKMPVMDGVETHEKIRELYPDLKVIILTMEDDQQYILHLINEGVNGYLLKNAEAEEMELAIKRVMEQGFYFSDNISKMVMKSVVNRTKNHNQQKIELSEREQQVLELICKEHTAHEIADKLILSSRTIEGYRTKLLEKTGAKNMAGLVVFALKHNLVNI